MPPAPAADAALAAFPDHYCGLLRFLTRRTGCAETARELTHDTWLRLVEGSQYQGVSEHDNRPAPPDAAPAPGDSMPPHDPRAYMYTVAAHLAANLHRHQARGARWFVQPGHADASAAAAAGDVARTHALRQAVAAVEQALHELPPRRRDIFLAHRLDGEGHAAIATQHGISIKTVEREVTAAMDAVHAAMLRWRGDPPATTPLRGRRKALAGLLGLAGIGVGTGATWCAWQLWRELAAQYELALTTPRGRRLSQPLPDGSRLVLDAASRAEVVFGATRRTVRLLAGSAFFAVARDAERPFIVETEMARVTVLGTHFSVELEDGNDGRTAALAVAVERGHVRVQGLASAQAVDLHDGDRWRIEADGSARVFRRTDAATDDDVAPWRDGWLDFRGTPLATAARRLARYHAQTIHVDEAVAGLPVLGRVHIADALAWLRLLPTSLPVRVGVAADGGVVIGPAPRARGPR
ncbi:FecR domain-containing protein [Sphaerotilus sp.]|uniref:FecR domain-containing protein n=1 Tax=Sphaerotilus sp. TaxID=2093942 RepID=UPI002ACD28DC|nr:FecR domain-containing protein [Sphaerotilus sp.]MDZ7855848.1 FecR domain-containing protein [Sphaerotilus sp.]